jgi:isochorismate synthase
VRFVTRPLDRDVDLLAWAGRDGRVIVRDGVGIAGRGEVARVRLHDALGWLGACSVDDHVGLPGCGPVALGALPYAGLAAGELVVPAVVLGRAADGTRWVTVADDGTGSGDLDTNLATAVAVARPEPMAEPSTVTVRSDRPAADWVAAVGAAVDEIRSGGLTKVVMARSVTVEADVAFDVAGVLARLRRAFGSSCYLFSLDGFVGASPELLVARAHASVRSHPLAGTVPRTGDPHTDARAAAGLLASDKDRWEHRLTIDAVHDALLPFCSWLDEEAEPSIVPVANVQHLGTQVEGRLSGEPPADVVTLLDALHPTPAVGGVPRERAIDAQRRLEQLDRGPYAGALGWLDAHGNGTFAVALRCARIEGAVARLYAGCGIVADSDPEAELAETRAKFQAMLGALVRV